MFDAVSVNAMTQTVALIAAGLWGVYTFVYQAQIAPSLAPPTVSLSSNLETVGKQKDTAAIKMSLTRTNPGQTSVRILALTYNAVGIKEHFIGDEEQNSDFAVNDLNAQHLHKSRYVGKPEREELLFKEGVLFEGANPNGSVSVLSPNETVTRAVMLYADRKKFDRIKLKVSLFFQKESESGRPLVLTKQNDGSISVIEENPCQPGPDCPAIEYTDYSTELSLWD
jgi:hypothetical protein